MTAKEKAEELVLKFQNLKITLISHDLNDEFAIPTGTISNKSARNCALICIEEILAQTAYYNSFFKNVKKELKLSINKVKLSK